MARRLNQRRRRPSRLRTALCVLGWLGTLGVLTAFLLGEFGHRVWVLELLSHFRLYMVAALGVCLLLLLCVRSRVGTALCASAFALGLASVAWWHFPHGAPGDGDRLRVCVANVLATNTDFTPTLDAVHALDPDLVVLIEATDEWVDAVIADGRWRVLHEEVRSYSGWVVVVAPLEGGAAPAVRCRTRDLSAGTSNIPAVEIETTLDGRALRVLGVHARSPSSASNASDRQAQYEAIAAWTRESDTPAVVAGDLNTTVWSPRYRALVRETGLVNGVRGHGTSRTWPGWLPAPLRIGIDHCLHAPALVCTERRHAPAGGSDHTPILFELAWREGGQESDPTD